MKEAIQKIRRGDVCYGTWLASGSPVVAELVAGLPFDWLLIDLEHGVFTETTFIDTLSALGQTMAAIMVRVPDSDATMISRVLDLGADGIMVPHVNDAAQAKAIIQSVYYPPLGKRGYSSSVRAYKYGLNPPSTPANVKPLVFAQIETVAGVAGAAEIAAVDGVDILFVGPSDLKLSLNTHTGPAPVFEDALQIVLNAVTSVKKSAGILLRDHTQVQDTKAKGFKCIAIDSDIALIRSAYAQLINRL